MLSENGAPFPGGGRPENDNPKNLTQKNDILGPIRVDDWFAVRKRTFSVFENLPQEMAYAIGVSVPIFV